MDPENKITASTISRMIILILALINQGLLMAGHPLINIDDNDINNFIALGWTIGSALVAAWKNNSFTKKAIAADKTFKNKKGEHKID